MDNLFIGAPLLDFNTPLFDRDYLSLLL